MPQGKPQHVEGAACDEQDGRHGEAVGADRRRARVRDEPHDHRHVDERPDGEHVAGGREPREHAVRDIRRRGASHPASFDDGIADEGQSVHDPHGDGLDGQVTAALELAAGARVAGTLHDAGRRCGAIRMIGHDAPRFLKEG